MVHILKQSAKQPRPVSSHAVWVRLLDAINVVADDEIHTKVGSRSGGGFRAMPA
jgi:hypothetical protein